MASRILSPIVLILVGLGFASGSAAVIVDVSSSSNCPIANANQVPLTAGTWVVTPIDQNSGGAYTAWNAWGSVSGCDSSGANCTNGWLTSYRIVASDVPDDGFGGGTYETPDLAFQNEAEGTSFTLPSAQTVSFYISDSNCGDNVGGVSLDVNQGVQTIPNALSVLLLVVILVSGSLLTLRVRGHLGSSNPAP